MTRLLEFKHEISYLKSRVELAQSSSIIALSQRTVFVFAPNATGSQPPNVFTVWTDLLAAVALTRGPITIQFDPAPGNGAITVPGGDLSGHKDIWFVGAVVPGAQVAPTITVTAPFTNGYPIRYSYLLIGYTGAAAPGINLTNSATGGEPNFFFDTNTIVVTTGGQPFIQLDGTVNTVTALISLYDDVFIQGAATVFKTLGANSLLQIRMFANATVSTNTLASAVVATNQVAIFSPSVTYNPAQAAVVSPAGVLNANFSYPSSADEFFARCAFYDSVQSALQVTPGANTAVIVAVITPRVTGRLLATVSLQFSPTAAGNANISTQSRAANSATAFTLGNVTALKGTRKPTTNQGCFAANASGTITGLSGGAITSLTHDFSVFSGSGLLFNYSWSGMVVPAAGSFTLQQDVAVAVCVEFGAGNISQQNSAGTGPLGTISVKELE